MELLIDQEDSERQTHTKTYRAAAIADELA
jgi:hypothetical protein